MEVTKVHDISVLHLFGEVSLMELDQIERTLNSLKKSQNHKIILDMASVDHIHYLVVKRLVENAVALRSHNGDLKLVSMTDDAKHVLKFTGADQHLEDYATISEGILSFLKQTGVDPESSTIEDLNHIPVLLDEVIESLDIKPDGVYIDCTGGLGGHSSEILKRLSSQGQLFICDYDEQAALRLRARFASHGNVTVLHERFSLVFDNLDFPFDGILADFGISSPQLDDENLGIGFQVENAPLDMRIDKRLTKTAFDILQESSQDELADLFFHLGGERQSRKIAAAIVYDRERDKIYKTAGELRGLCERVLGKFYRGKKISPATKVFQALRIAVNRELDEVAEFLKKAPHKLKSGGRLAVISFHEGEDRQAKQVFKDLAFGQDFRLVVKKAIQPSDEELERNPRARSARLRVLEKN